MLMFKQSLHFFCVGMSSNTPVSTDTDCIPVSQIEFVSHTNFSTKKLKLDTPPLRNKLAWYTDQGRAGQKVFVPPEIYYF